MWIKLSLVFLIFFIFFSTGIAQVINSDVKDILNQTFGSQVEIKLIKYELEKTLRDRIEKKVKQKFYSTTLFFYEIKKNGITDGYALVDNVYGKSLPITFIVVYDKNGNIILSEVIKYREQYGGAVKNKSWNDQFIGKNGDASFEVGKDLSSISGATISVNSVTKGIQKLSILMDEIISNK